MWYVGACESVFGSCGQVLVLRNSILAFLSWVLKVPQGRSWLKGGSPAARTWIRWPSGHSCWRARHRSKGNVSSPNSLGSDDGGWARVSAQELILTCSSFPGCSCLFVQELYLWLPFCFLFPLCPQNFLCHSRLLGHPLGRQGVELLCVGNQLLGVSDP